MRELGIRPLPSSIRVRRSMNIRLAPVGDGRWHGNDAINVEPEDRWHGNDVEPEVRLQSSAHQISPINLRIPLLIVLIVVALLAPFSIALMVAGVHFWTPRQQSVSMDTRSGVPEIFCPSGQV